MHKRWINKYVGIPFKAHGRTLAGLDCYGLIQVVMANEKAIFLPDYNEEYSDVDDKDNISKAIAKYSGGWIPVEAGKESPFDVIIMNMMNYPMHAGLVAFKGTMLHALEGCNSVCESYLHGKWRSPGRIVGFYRHMDLA